jgi:hypothetical protein
MTALHYRTTAIGGLLTIVLLGAAATQAAEPTVTVPVAGETLQIVREVAVDGAKTGSWSLRESPEAAALVAQLVPALEADGTAAKRSRLVAAVPPKEGAAGSRTLSLSPGETSGARSPFHFKQIDDKSLELRDGERPVFVYNFGTITRDDIPEKEHRRSRACYVHPLWGLDGEVLTDDFPKDHYHHHGVFWTWPHVSIDGKQHDLWAGNTIRQKFHRWLHREAGPVAAVLGVENGWYVGDEQVMVERIWICAFQTADDARAIDFELSFVPVGKPVTLRGAEGKSYGGFTVRFAPPPKAEAAITVPAGRAREDLPDTPLPWADFTSTFGGQTAPSGAAIFVHPSHPNFPPTWLTRHYGPLCVGWPGVKGQTIEPGQPFRLTYRLWVHRGAANVEQLGRAYRQYTASTTNPAR